MVGRVTIGVNVVLWTVFGVMAACEGHVIVAILGIVAAVMFAASFILDMEGKGF